MKKYKYQTLTQNEKKEAKKNFYQTETGKVLKTRLTRILVYSIIIIAFGIYLFIEAYIKKDSYAQYFYSVFLIIIGCIFLISRYIILLKQVNYYIVTKKK